MEQVMPEVVTFRDNLCMFWSVPVLLDSVTPRPYNVHVAAPLPGDISAPAEALGVDPL